MSIDQRVPMWRLTERIVRSGFVMAWRLATSPTSTSPFLAKATTEGVVRPPSALAMTTGSPASSTETTEFVVPRSIPTALGIRLLPFLGQPMAAGCGQRPRNAEPIPLSTEVTGAGRALGPSALFGRTKLKRSMLRFIPRGAAPTAAPVRRGRPNGRPAGCGRARGPRTRAGGARYGDRHAHPHPHAPRRERVERG